MLVVGGGIYGLITAYDASQRGLSVALVERGDFGAATSFNHLKTIHGGLRYLQTANFGRMRQSILERRAFARIAPRFVAPLPFAMPTRPSLSRNPVAMKVAFAVDALVGHDRNDRVDVSRQLPAGRIISGADCRDLFEGALDGVTSAAVWHDYETTDGDRLTLSFARAAVKYGAVLANYAEASGFLLNNGRLAGINVRDTLTGDTFDIRSRVVVNAAGPWSAAVIGRSGSRESWPLLKAMNLVTSRPARRAALVAPTRDGRALVMLPWRGRTLIGTSESADQRQADDQQAKRDEVGAFLRQINDTFPAFALREDEITLVHRGIVPAIVRGGQLTLSGESRVIDHAAAGGLSQLITLVGVKYTTARAVAEQAVDLVFDKLGRPPARCRTAATALPEAGLGDRDAVDPVLQAMRDEMAQTLVDVIVRRTGLGAAGHPGDGVAAEVAARMQMIAGWSDERTRREIDELAAFYRIL